MKGRNAGKEDGMPLLDDIRNEPSVKEAADKRFSSIRELCESDVPARRADGLRKIASMSDAEMLELNQDQMDFIEKVALEAAATDDEKKEDGGKKEYADGESAQAQPDADIENVDQMTASGKDTKTESGDLIQDKDKGTDKGPSGDLENTPDSPPAKTGIGDTDLPKDEQPEAKKVIEAVSKVARLQGVEDYFNEAIQVLSKKAEQRMKARDELQSKIAGLYKEYGKQNVTALLSASVMAGRKSVVGR